jgi:transcriptional regulator with XRE-family HTH domain
MVDCIGVDPTEYGAPKQPNPEGRIGYLRRMGTESKKTLALTVLALMQKHFGGKNLTKLAREAVGSPGNATRLLDGKTSVSVDMLDRIARRFKLEPWQLLVPDFDPSAPPKLAQPTSPSFFRSRYSPVGLELLDLFERVQDEDLKERLYARFQSEINAALQRLPTQLSEYEPYERDGAPTPAPPATTQKQPGKRQADPSEGSTPSPAASRRRAR